MLDTKLVKQLKLVQQQVIQHSVIIKLCNRILHAKRFDLAAVDRNITCFHKLAEESGVETQDYVERKLYSLNVGNNITRSSLLIELSNAIIIIKSVL